MSKLITLASAGNHHSVCIDLHGGRIKNLTLGGRTILGAYARIDGKIGSTHVCVPNFAGEGKFPYALLFHGPARNLLWKVSKQTQSFLEITLCIPATPGHPSDILAIQTFELGVQFRHAVTVTNVGNQSIPVNLGIHNYFDTPHGWEGAKVNGVDITSAIRTNGSVQTKEANTIELPGQPPITVHTRNVKHLVTWTGVKDGSYDSAYVCIEPVHHFEPTYFGSPKSMLRPGETRTISQEISIGQNS